MKMFLGNTPMKNLNIHHYEIPTNDCDMVASDLQAGKTAVARGQKITGTGKSFEFAFYGQLRTNMMVPLPTIINVIEIGSSTHPIQMSIDMNNMKQIDFSTEQIIGTVIVNETTTPITVVVENNMLTVGCSESINLQVFYGKDNYV